MEVLINPVLLLFQDIDNLRCDQSSCGDVGPSGQTEVTSVTYTLKNLLLAGQCFQTMYGQFHQVPPNGLQLTLSRSSEEEEHPNYVPQDIDHTDTLVMQNLGYYQLQANPGLWKLNLAVGRARELYEIENGQEALDGGILVAVKSFADVMKRLTVAKRPGKEQVPLLQDANGDDDSDDIDEASGGMWESISSLFGGGSDKKKKSKPALPKPTNEEDNRIHVFSLATGHMYERLLRIMMLSVTKRTSVPVKFWLLENYLSPTFKEIAAHMAKTYGFEVPHIDWYSLFVHEYMMYVCSVGWVCDVQVACLA